MIDEWNIRKAPNNIAKARRYYESKSGMKFTQADAAYEFGVSLSTYRNYEQEKSLPDGGTAVAMANKYGVSVDYLMGLSEMNILFEKFDDDIKNDEREIILLFRELPEIGKHALITGLREYVNKKTE